MARTPNRSSYRSALGISALKGLAEGMKDAKERRLKEREIEFHKRVADENIKKQASQLQLEGAAAQLRLKEAQEKRRSITGYNPKTFAPIFSEQNPVLTREEAEPTAKMIQDLTGAPMFGGEAPTSTDKPARPPVPPALSAEPRSIPSAKQKDINVLRDVKRSTEEAAQMLIEDLDRSDTGERRRLVTGPGSVTTLNVPGMNRARQAFTSIENTTFFGKLRKTQSKELTDATGAQRGFAEVQFLTPATIMPEERDESILFKSSDNILSTGLNLQRAARYLRSQGIAASEAEKDALVNLSVVNEAISRLDRVGANTSMLKDKLHLWASEVNLDLLTEREVPLIMKNLKPEHRLLFKQRLTSGSGG